MGHAASLPKASDVAIQEALNKIKELCRHDPRGLLISYSMEEKDEEDHFWFREYKLCFEKTGSASGIFRYRHSVMHEECYHWAPSYLATWLWYEDYDFIAVEYLYSKLKTAGYKITYLPYGLLPRGSSIRNLQYLVAPFDGTKK